MAEQDFIKAGFTVVGTEASENKLLSFLKENYPSIIKDNEIDLQELKAIAGLPIDEKVNGYGLNFVGRNFARAKYAQKTEKELRLNTALSKDIDTTENLVLKGDNLDSLKILKNHYSGKIKCIYIDPPYNTTNDEFVYPDKFDKEEAGVLGLANLSESDFARMDFSFKTKKSHNGWLTFMYPRLLLARDLLSKDGVIFISIDDNEQANLKLLCDDVFGEENFVANIIWERAFAPVNLKKHFSESHDYIICYAKHLELLSSNGLARQEDDNRYKNPDNDIRGVWTSADMTVGPIVQNKIYEITTPSGKKILPTSGRCWLFTKDRYEEMLADNRIWFGENGSNTPRVKKFLSEVKQGITPMTIWKHTDVGHSQDATQRLKELFDGKDYFDYPKSVDLIKRCIQIYSNSNDIILDFFAGSGTTGHAVMQLNAEDGGNRKFILCQIDEPIKEDKPAYKFCIENNLPPVISSITIERLKRAGEKIVKDVENETEEDKKQVPDIGFKVFDSVEAPKLKVDDKGQISITENETDALSRIYNMIFTVGLDEPTQVPEEVVKDCIYKIRNHFYITNSEKITSDDYSNAIKNGKVFIDGWTASLNGTLQNYKEDVKIVF
ncbi:MAG: site-specific DNA-methyltransferase [Bacteroidia bacterium]|nr:site-specific DNA-methyltransferase [Bacteroidia bacterium]